MTRPDPSTYYTPPHILALINAADPAPLTATENPWVRTAARARRSVAVKGAGTWALRPDGLMGWIGRGGRAGVAVVGHPSGRAFIAVVAALGFVLLARDARRIRRARGMVRAYRSGECPL